MTNLYLDINGTLINNGNRRNQVAIGCIDFLKFATEHFQCKWLSLHSQSGKKERIKNVFGSALGQNNMNEEWVNVLNCIEPAIWHEWKTSGIDFSQKFYWIDDYISNQDAKVLMKHNAYNSYIPAHLDQNVHEMQRLQGVLLNILNGIPFIPHL